MMKKKKDPVKVTLKAKSDEIVGPREAAEFLGCSIRQVQRLAQIGKILSYRVGSEHRFKKQDLLRYQRQTLVGPTESLLAAASGSGAVSVSYWCAVLLARRIWMELHPHGWTGASPTIHQWHMRLVQTCRSLDENLEVDSDELIQDLPQEIKTILDAAAQ